MDTEKEFEKWSDNEWAKVFHLTGYCIARTAFAAGRKSGMEEAAEIAAEWAMDYVDVDHAPLTCGDFIRQRIEEMK